MNLQTKWLIPRPPRLRSAMCAFWVVMLCNSSLGQTTTFLEGFEFAVNDVQAAAGVIDITDPPNSPAFYISGSVENASPQEPGGFFSIGTSAAFCLNFQVPCVPGSFIGFRLPVDADRFPSQCPAGGNYMPLNSTYGDPAHPGSTAPDYPLADLSVIWDVYGDGGFADGLTGSHLWLRLIDCEGESFEFVNLSEVSLYSEIWTFNVKQGDDLVRIRPESLTDVPGGDRMLTEIAAIEVLVQDTDSPPTTIGNWYVDYLRIGEPGPALMGDWDGDGDVDRFDFAAFPNCMVGPGQVMTVPCQVFDFDFDADVDATDFSWYQGMMRPAGDWDSNGVVNQQDSGAFPGCLAGPGQTLTVPCQVFDFDADTDVDATDYALFQAALRKLGDWNGDGIVDRKDSAALPGCLVGPDEPLPIPCHVFDFDADGDVDATDHALFQSALRRLGDWNLDGVVDLQDFAEFPGCLAGPGEPLTVACEVFDFDFDADVDAADFASCQATLTGPP